MCLQYSALVQALSSFKLFFHLSSFYSLSLGNSLQRFCSLLILSSNRANLSLLTTVLMKIKPKSKSLCQILLSSSRWYSQLRAGLHLHVLQAFHMFDTPQTTIPLHNPCPNSTFSLDFSCSFKSPQCVESFIFGSSTSFLVFCSHSQVLRTQLHLKNYQEPQRAFVFCGL